MLIIKQWSGKKRAGGGITGGLNNKDYLLTLDRKDSTGKSTGKKPAFSGNWNDKHYFSVPLADFESKCDPYYPRGWDLTFGVMTIPIKLRGASRKTGSLFEYDEKFNIGLSAGVQRSFNSRKERSISFLINTSISTVRLDSLNTKGYQLESGTSGAFTVATGFVFRQSDFNIGIFLGWDKVPGVLGTNWVHNNKPWLGVGIGFSIFSVSLSGEKTGGNKGGDGKSAGE